MTNNKKHNNTNDNVDKDDQAKSWKLIIRTQITTRINKKNKINTQRNTIVRGIAGDRPVEGRLQHELLKT